MSTTRELISRTTRGQFRALTTDSTVGRIAAAFQDEGFAPNPDSTWDDGSARRTTTQHYLEAVNWTDPGQVGRVLRAMGRIMDEFDEQHTESLRKSLRRDGCQIDDGIITLPPTRLPRVPLDGLRDPAAILDNLDRIQRAIDDDPAQAVGSAKELIESTAKTVLLERGRAVDEKDDLPALVSKAQQSLDLHPAAATPGPDGAPVRRDTPADRRHPRRRSGRGRPGPGSWCPTRRARLRRVGVGRAPPRSPVRRRPRLRRGRGNRHRPVQAIPRHRPPPEPDRVQHLPQCNAGRG